MFQQLMISRRFAPIFWCQLFSALNDNFVKNALVILILYHTATGQSGALVTLAGGVLIAPFLVLSALGGEIADKYDKAAVARRLKLAEIPFAGIAAAGFLLDSIPLLFLALALFGIMAALFGPIKYGILPDHLATRELPAGNALVEGATFFAILTGTIAGGLAVAEKDAAGLIAVIVMAMAVLALLSARAIPPTGAAAPHLGITANPLRSTLALVRGLKAEPRLWTGGLIVSWFWLVGVIALSLLPTLTKEQLGGTAEVVTLSLFIFTVGISAGSLAAARASRLRPNLALVPIGALLMGLFSLDLAWAATGLAPAAVAMGPGDVLGSSAGLRLMFDLFALAVAGGLFIVPSFAAVQAWAPPDRRARVVAAVNVLNAVFMTVASLGVAGAQYAGATAPLILLGLGLANLVVLGLVVHAWGKDGVQDIAAFVFRLGYGLEVKGLEHVPPAGERVIITPNHTSLMDGPVMHAILPGHAAFAVDTAISQAWWVKPFLKLINAHTMDPTRPMATRTLVNLVKQGETLVIFPEGRVTVTGGLMKVYDGAAMIADRADAWIVPVRIEGLAQTPWSYLRPSQIRKAWFPKVRVTVLPPRKLEVPAGLKGKARRQAASAALQDTMIDAAVETARLDQTLFEALAEAKATRDTGKPIVADALGTELSYRRLILGAQVLGRRLAPLAPPGAAVGVMLPNSAGVAVSFFALQTIGRVPAMINYTAGPQNVVSACRAAGVEVVLTSRAFVEKARLGELVARLSLGHKVVFLEDVRTAITMADKVAGLLLGSRPQVVRDCNEPAAVLFTSGSEGTPKGVVLSHRNILANATQSLTRIAAHGDDKVFNVLPVFHSFGLTAGLVMPLTGGVPVYLYPSPLHYRIVPELVYQTNATILFGTDTFLNGYARAAHPYDLHSVRLILAGAEAVKQRTRDIYLEKFGVRILEGYGVTETAPVLAINTPLANKPGTVGRLSPLMEARLQPVPGIAEGGRLLVRGPNVMLGYYRVERPGVLEPPEDGWHDTGDIVSIDAQGFITIKGRAKRFAKIGGEMVSLSAVEALAAGLWPNALTVVVALPDARKGERLVLLTTQADAGREAILRHAKAAGASELAVPSVVLAVPALPLLGSGKPDYGATLSLAAEKLAGAAVQASGVAA
ncbi:MAG: acyl-[ACP]--phospholipid O-acyltransferase [Hyphomicrobiaceae bacterium]|nr:acyl-[ACP]--phospholipid O-acyltransferase [Hyphomicrobiaceae bacterium]